MSDLLLVLLVIIYSLTCLFLVLTVLLQAGKGGGLSSLGSGAGALSDSLGATGAEKTLVKATSWAAGFFLVLSMVLTLYGSHLERSGAGVIGTIPTPASSETAPAPEGAPATGQPAAPASAPETAPAEGSIPAESAPVSSEAPAQPPPQAPSAPAETAPAQP